ncbi:MAG: chemotaxis protein CheW [Proteobacteria bacterium]|nr:chemotaxis protein CheW [Pseudomonadota bacterium]
MNLLIFRISDLFFSFQIEFIERIVEKKHDISSVPLVPSFISGIMNFQGRIITIIDLGKLFNINFPSINNLILISRNANNLGFLVDEIIGFKRIDDSLIEKLEPCEVFINNYQFKSYILNGIYKVPISFINLTEIEKFIQNPDNWSGFNES